MKAATAVDTASVSESLNIALLSDTAYLSAGGGILLSSTTPLDNTAATTTDNFIWSPISTSTLQATDQALETYNDWTNGYGLPGFPAVGTDFPVQTWTRSN